MRRVAAQFDNSTARRVVRVVDPENLAAEWTPDLSFAVLTTSENERESVRKLSAGGLRNVGWLAGEGFELGDIVVYEAQKAEATVLFRESDVHHSLLLTNRCNSYCLMCSQPPTKHNDSWLIEEVLDVIRHIRSSPVTIGFTGGEPLLLRSNLRRVLDAIAAQHPMTRVEVLTNGRLFSDLNVVDALLNGCQTNIGWLVPLYGHADFVHDFVVQSPGAFEETLTGLLALQEHRQSIQLRIVLIKPVLQVLPELCAFIGRNLPFVHDVALMACEPIGFALANREQCEVDLGDWSEVLCEATRVLDRYSVPYLLMNAPLCSLPRQLWPRAQKSISDWKNTFSLECEECMVKQRCSGLFAWHERGWKPTKICAIREVTS